MRASPDADVLVVGAGISGLICASHLQAGGQRVRVVEKSRGVGGRMATRRMGAARLDHGVQFFTASRQPFQSMVNQWLAAGLVRVWQRPMEREGEPDAFSRYCGVHGMTDVPKHLAAGLDVRVSQRINALERAGNGWHVHTEAGETFSAAKLVLTPPLPQSLDLLDTIRFPQLEPACPALRDVYYARAITMLVRLDRPSGLPEPGYCELETPACRWVADNQLKGISPQPCVTVQAASDFAAGQWETKPADCVHLMLKSVTPHLGGAKVIDCGLHRWLYALPVNAWPQRFFKSADLGLWLAGDAFGGGRVEQAACSGLAAAADILGVD